MPGRVTGGGRRRGRLTITVTVGWLVVLALVLLALVLVRCAVIAPPPAPVDPGVTSVAPEDLDRPAK